MSKAADSIHRRFGQNLSESLGVRSGVPGAAPGGAFPRESHSPNSIGKPAQTSPDDGRTRNREAGHMEIDRIVPDPDQPRKEFSADAIDRLSASLLKHGQLMPIRVRWNAAIGKWLVISGERRYRAAIKAGLKTVACIFADDGLTQTEILQEQIIENLLREDLKPIEQAKAYRQLMDMHGWTAKELSGELQVSQGAISKSLMLLTLPDELQVQVEAGAIPATAAYEVAKVEDPTKQREIVGRIISEELTRDATAEVVREVSGRPGRASKTAAKGGGKAPASGRGAVHAFKTANAKIVVTFPRKTVRDEDLLAALSEAIEQVKAAMPPPAAVNDGDVMRSLSPGN
ncbi:ParB/RepB/Spo0J family partition protein (plasmid) [Tundrisphaera sp. TA3]|uniref:ParB/RepB/Spo0J family partition protein n=1 Tax=Tundrisphaera sp. TA3 TaxID=3435775 RepID=UPI003EBF37F0